MYCNVYQNDADNFRVPVLRQRGCHIFELDGVKCHTFNWKIFDLFTHYIIHSKTLKSFLLFYIKWVTHPVTFVVPFSLNFYFIFLLSSVRLWKTSTRVKRNVRLTEIYIAWSTQYMMNAKLSQERVFTTLEQPSPLQAVTEEQDLSSKVISPQMVRKIK